jgi:hypothetical protein
MEPPIFNTYMNFSRHHLCCFIVVALFVLDKSMAWNMCLQHPCFKNLCKIAQDSKNSDSNAQHILSDLLTHSWFHSMLFAPPGYHFPYTAMNRCLYFSSLKLVLRPPSCVPSPFELCVNSPASADEVGWQLHLYSELCSGALSPKQAASNSTLFLFWI